MRHGFRLLLAMAALFWCTVARANPTQHVVTICVTIDVGFDAASGGDIWTNNSVDQKARGVHGSSRCAVPHNLVTPANDPENRWRDAALSNSYLSFHNAAKDNGLDH